MSVPSIAPRLASAYGDYTPQNDFEKKTILALDEVLRELRALATHVVSQQARLDEAAGRMEVLAESAALSAAAARDSALHAQHSSEQLEDERRAAYRQGRAGLPLESLPPPPERPTDPELEKSTDPSPPPEPEP